MAMLLMKKTGRPRTSAAYGITEPNGNPANFRECVDRLPVRASEIRVRARSASEGSGFDFTLTFAPEGMNEAPAENRPEAKALPYRELTLRPLAFVLLPKSLLQVRQTRRTLLHQAGEDVAGRSHSGSPMETLRWLIVPG